MTAITVLFFVLIREEPKDPPSYIAKRKNKPINFTLSLTQLANNSNFMILLASFAIEIGVFAAFGSLLGSLLVPFGFTTAKTSLTGGVLLTSGILTAPIICSLVGRTKQFIVILRTLTCLMAFTFWCALVLI